MIQALIGKKIKDALVKEIAKKGDMKKLLKYVEQDNDLDLKVKELENDRTILIKQLEVTNKKIDKYGRYIEELEKNVAILTKDSHAPIFGKNDYKNIIKRLKKLEKEK